MLHNVLQLRRPLRNLTPPIKLHDIRLIRVCLALKRLQPGQPIIPQAILGQHTTDGLAQDLSAAQFRHQAIHGDLAQAARAGVVSVVQLLPALLAGRVQGRAVGYHDVVAAVRRRVPDRLVLAHEQDGDARRETPERGGRHVRGVGRGERADGGEGVVGGAR